MASRADISAGKAFVELYAKSGPLTHGLADARRRLHDFGTAAVLVGVAIAAAGSAIIAPITTAIMKFTSMGSELNDMAGRTGVAASALAELKFAAEQSGAALSDVELAIRNIQKTVHAAATGSKGAKESLAGLGLTAAQLKDKLPDQQLQMIADRLATIQDPAKRAAIAIDILGKSGAQLLPMVGELAALRAEARRLGIVPTDQAVKDAAAIGNLFAKIRSVAFAAIFEIGSAVGPVLLPVLEMVKDVGASFAIWVRHNGDVVRTIARVGAGIFAAGAAVSAFGTALIFVSKGLGVVQFGLRMFTPFISPVRIVGAALAAISVTARNLGTIALQTFRGMTAAISQAALHVSGMVSSIAAAGWRMAAAVGSAAVAAGRSLYNAVASQITRLVALAPGAFGRITASARSALAAASNAGSAFSREMSYWLNRPFQYFAAIAPLLASDFALAWQNAGIRVRRIMGLAADVMRAAWSAATAAVSTAVGQVTAYIAARWSAVANPVAASIIAAWSVMSAAVSARVGHAWNAIAARTTWLATQIKTFLGPVLPLLQADLGRIVGYARAAFTAVISVARVAAGGVVAAWRYAGPAIATNLTSAVTAAFARIRVAGAATAGLLTRGIGGAGRGLGGLLSGGAGLLGMLGAGAGGMLGSLAGIVPQLLLIGSSLSMLLSPATLLIGAVAGGIFLWTKYSASGRAAMASLMTAFSPFVAIATQTFAGIGDAIKAGDLALAGQIAMAGLKLAFVTGMVALGDAVSGTWGKAIKDIGGKLAGGDFAGAWQTAVKGMAAVWDAWSEGVVKTFTSAISSVVNVWKEGVGKISDFLLQASASGGALGKIASGILGVDMQKESQREGVKWELQQRNLLKMVDQHKAAIAKAEAEGDTVTAEKQRRGLANTEAELAKGGFQNPAIDPVEEAKNNARAQVKGTADAIDEALRQMDADAEARNQASNDNLNAALPADVPDAVAQAAAELAELTKKAAEARANVDKAKAVRQNEANFNPDDFGKNVADASNVAGSFSAAALVALGQGGGKDQIAKEQLAEQRRARQALERADKKLAQMAKAQALEFVA